MATRLVLFCVSFYSAFSLAGLGTFCYHCPAAVRRVGYSFFAHPQIELRPLVLCNRQSVSLSSPISRTRPNRILILAGGSCEDVGHGREQDISTTFSFCCSVFLPLSY